MRCLLSVVECSCAAVCALALHGFMCFNDEDLEISQWIDTTKVHDWIGVVDCSFMLDFDVSCFERLETCETNSCLLRGEMLSAEIWKQFRITRISRIRVQRNAQIGETNPDCNSTDFDYFPIRNSSCFGGEPSISSIRLPRNWRQNTPSWADARSIWTFFCYYIWEYQVLLITGESK